MEPCPCAEFAQQVIKQSDLIVAVLNGLELVLKLLLQQLGAIALNRHHGRFQIHVGDIDRSKASDGVIRGPLTERLLHRAVGRVIQHQTCSPYDAQEQSPHRRDYCFLIHVDPLRTLVLVVSRHGS
jgi:hypothetical protein